MSDDVDNDMLEDLEEASEQKPEIGKAVKAIRLAMDQLKKAELLLGQSSEEVGIYGYFDGEFMMRDDGKKKYRVPPNYVSKTMLVTGDKLRMYTDESGEVRYKQTEKVERQKLDGIAKKDDQGQWYAVTDQGNYKLVKASVVYFEVKEDDKIRIHIPEDKKDVEWAALECVIRPEKEVLAADQISQNAATSPLAKKPVMVGVEESQDEPLLGAVNEPEAQTAIQDDDEFELR